MYSNFEEPQLPNLHLATEGARNASHARKSRYSLALWPTLKEQSTWKSFDANLSSLNELVCELVKQSETSKSLDGTHEDPVLMRQLISSPAYIPGFRSLRTCKAMKSFDTKHPAIQNTRRHCIVIFVAKFSQSKHSASLTIRTLWRRCPTSDVPIYTLNVPWDTGDKKRTLNKNSTNQSFHHISQIQIARSLTANCSVYPPKKSKVMPLSLSLSLS